MGDILGSDGRVSGEIFSGGAEPTGDASVAKRKLAGGERQWLEEIRGELQSKRYRPEPVLRVMIPKAGGGQRALGIPDAQRPGGANGGVSGVDAHI